MLYDKDNEGDKSGKKTQNVTVIKGGKGVNLFPLVLAPSRLFSKEKYQRETLILCFLIGLSYIICFNISI